MKRFSIIISMLLVAFFMSASIAVADVPLMTNYQGFLTDDQGNPISGMLSITFSIYDTPVGGVALWTEIHPSVTVDNGMFDVMLGSVIPIPGSALARDTTLLGIQVGVDPEITPRTRLVSVPYAYRIDTIDGATGGTIGVDDSTGVTIEANSNGATLEMWGSLFDWDNDVYLICNSEGTEFTMGKIGDTYIQQTTDATGVKQVFYTAEDDTFVINIMVDSTGSEITLSKMQPDGEKVSISAGPTGGEIMIVNTSVVDRSIYNAHGLYFIDADTKAYDTTASFTEGGIKIADGAFDGYVLTSDSEGVGTWQPGGSGSGCWQCPGNYTYLTDIDDSVGIGTETPLAKLHVEGDAYISNKATIGPANINTGSYGFVAGQNNTATGNQSCIGGGGYHTATGDQSLVTGGWDNDATGWRSAVLGGVWNTASGQWSSVGGRSR